MENNENNIAKRTNDIAVKITVKSIESSPFVREEERGISYILHNNLQIERVNVIGLVIEKEEDSNNNNIKRLLVDDGTGIISVTVFDEQSFQKIEKNQTVLIIGKVGKYGGELYISAKIVKEVDKKWHEVRQKELKINNRGQESNQQTEQETQERTQTSKVSEEQHTEEEKKEPEANQITPEQKMWDTIKKNDDGQGADMNKVMQEYAEDDGEELVQKLKERGDIFEAQPGKLKVLE